MRARSDRFQKVFLSLESLMFCAARFGVSGSEANDIPVYLFSVFFVFCE